MWTLNNFLDDSLTPTDEQMGTLATADWWKYVKPHFDDEIWQFYFDRVVFYNRKFPEHDEEITYQNIIRSFIVNLKTKARQYERLYDAAMADYNPLWNVDGVTGRIWNDTHTGTDTRAKSGYDQSALSGTDRSTLGGQDRNVLSGTDRVVTAIDDIHNTDVSKDDVTRTGSESIAKSGVDTTTVGVATFDHQNFLNKEESGTNYDSADTHTYNQVKDAHQMTSQDITDRDENQTTTYGKTDTTQYGRTDSTQYGKTDRMTYNSQDQETKALEDKHVEMEIRQGNIGVTKSSELLKDTLDLYTNELMDFIKLVVRDCVNTCTYGVEGI